MDSARNGASFVRGRPAAPRRVGGARGKVEGKYGGERVGRGGKLGLRVRFIGVRGGVTEDLAFYIPR